MREAWLGRFLLVFALALAIVVVNAAFHDEVPAPVFKPVAVAPLEIRCDRIAAPDGDDAASGTASAPFATAQRLADSLSPGETGCLRAGTYTGIEIEPDDRPGYAETKLTTPQTTLASFPGERARLMNRLWIAASGITVANLDLVGTNPSRFVASSLTIGGQRGSEPITAVRVVGNDITNDNQRICVGLGAPGYGRPSSTVIEANRVHDCGVYEYPPDATAPPPGEEFTGHWNEDHGIYVGLADDTVIRRNLIYDNASRGVQLYPDSQRTQVVGNVIDGNGEGVAMGGDAETASSGNLIERNLITSSTERFNVEHSFEGCTEAGEGICPNGNVVIDNCLVADSSAIDYAPEIAPDRAELQEFYEEQGGVLDPGSGPYYDVPLDGLDPRANLVLEPGTDVYTDRAAKDFTLDPSSPCLAEVGDPAAGIRR